MHCVYIPTWPLAKLKLFGITYLVGKIIKVQTFISGSIG